MREKLIAADLANENTVFALNHFSHNGGDIIYDDFVKIAEAELFSKKQTEIELKKRNESQVFLKMLPNTKGNKIKQHNFSAVFLCKRMEKANRFRNEDARCCKKSKYKPIYQFVPRLSCDNVSDAPIRI